MGFQYPAPSDRPQIHAQHCYDHKRNGPEIIDGLKDLDKLLEIDVPKGKIKEEKADCTAEEKFNRLFLIHELGLSFSIRILYFYERNSGKVNKKGFF